MFRLVIAALCLNSVLGGAVHLAGAGLGLAGGYGGIAHGGLGLAHGGLGLGLARGGFGLGLAAGPAIGIGTHGVIPAAVHSRRAYEVVPVPTQQDPAQLTQIDVDPVDLPVAIRFVSKSSPVLIDQVHIPGEPGTVQETHSEDEPHRVIHTVSRPVIQEVREVIQPYRTIQQEVRPVLEEVNTVVARGERIRSVVAPRPVIAAAPVAVAAPAPIAVAAPVAVAAGPIGIAHGGLGALGGIGHGAIGTIGGFGLAGATKIKSFGY